MPGLGRVGDNARATPDPHACPRCPHTVSGPAFIGSPNVNVNGFAALRVGDLGTHTACCDPNRWHAKKGSSTVRINGMPAHRLGDEVGACGGVGELFTGSDDVRAGGDAVG